MADGRPAPAANFATRVEWLRYRRNGIGGSDIPVILGESKFCTPYELWLEKTGAFDDSASDAKIVDDPKGWGNVLEAGILQMYALKTGREVANDGPHAVFRHPEKPHLMDTPDAFAFVPERGAWGVLNVKTSTTWSRWRGQVPDSAVIQLHHEMHVLGLDYAEIPYFVATDQPLAIFPIERNDELVAVAVEAADRFWESVVRGTPPTMDWQHPTADALVRKLYPKANGKAVRLDADAAALADDFEAFGEQESAARKAKEARAAELKRRLGENAWGYLPDGRVVKWKEYHRRGYTVAAADVRKFDVLEKAPADAPDPND